MKLKNIGIVCVHFEPKKLSRTLLALQRIERSALALHSVFVANHEDAVSALNSAGAKPGESSEVLLHDNSGMEFGGYQAGLDQLLRAVSPEWVLFANDTFATHHNFEAVSRQKLVGELKRTVDFPMVIGQVKSLPRSYELAGLRTHRWITTNLFALNRPALRALGNRVYWPEIESLVTETSEIDKFFALSVDNVLRDHLRTWLFCDRADWHWYASEPLQPANAAKMARKARSILQEKYLAALLDSSGAAFADLNELSFTGKVWREAERGFSALINRNP